MSKKSYEKANFASPKGWASFKWPAWVWRGGEILAVLFVVGALLRVLPELWAVIEAVLSGQ